LKDIANSLSVDDVRVADDLHPFLLHSLLDKINRKEIKTMNVIQLYLFTFAAMLYQEQNADAKLVVELKNFINDGKYPLLTAKSEQISANLNAIRLLKSLSYERPFWEIVTIKNFITNFVTIFC
jgi:hypothetical protein